MICFHHFSLFEDHLVFESMEADALRRKELPNSTIPLDSIRFVIVVAKHFADLEFTCDAFPNLLRFAVADEEGGATSLKLLAYFGKLLMNKVDPRVIGFQPG